MNTSTMNPNQRLQDQTRLKAVTQYLPVIADAYARTARFAARAAATPFALVCMVDDTNIHLKSGFGVDIRQAKQRLPDDLSAFLPEQFWQTNHPNQLEALNRLFASKSGWQKHFFAFHASLPLRGADGQILGALIVLDEQIRELDTHAIAMLEDIAEALITELDLRQQLEQKNQSETPATPEFQTPEAGEKTLLDELFEPKKLLENSATALIAERLDGTIIYANQSVQNIFGYTNQALIGANSSSLLPDFQVELAPDLLEILHGGQTLTPILAKRRHQDGTEISLYISYAPIFDQEHRVIGISSNYIAASEIQLPLMPPTQNTALPNMIAAVFHVNVEGRITNCVGASMPLFETPAALIDQLIFEVFEPYNALLEATCFALLGEEHESTIQLGTQLVRLHLHPVHRVGQPSDVIGIAIPLAQ